MKTSESYKKIITEEIDYAAGMMDKAEDVEKKSIFSVLFQQQFKGFSTLSMIRILFTCMAFFRIPTLHSPKGFIRLRPEIRLCPYLGYKLRSLLNLLWNFRKKSERMKTSMEH